jgi:hypothetical protein
VLGRERVSELRRHDAGLVPDHGERLRGVVGDLVPAVGR